MPLDQRMEWGLKALDKGKHVLMDTPVASNLSETRRLFRCSHVHPNMEDPKLLLEMLPYRFHPSWICFDRHLSRPDIEYAKVCVTVPSPGRLLKSNFKIEQSASAMVDYTFAISMLYGIFQRDPLACTHWQTDAAPPPHYGHQCYHGKWEYPSQ